MNLFRKIINYFYTRKCLSLISEDNNLVNSFSLVDKDSNIHKYPQYQNLFGNLNILIKMDKLEPDPHVFIQSKVAVMDQLSMTMGISELVTVDTRHLITDENDSFWLVQFKPAIKFVFVDYFIIIVIMIVIKIIYNAGLFSQIYNICKTLIN